MLNLAPCDKSTILPFTAEIIILAPVNQILFNKALKNLVTTVRNRTETIANTLNLPVSNLNIIVSLNLVCILYDFDLIVFSALIDVNHLIPPKCTNISICKSPNIKFTSIFKDL